MAELKVPEEVMAALGDDPQREALEALLLHLLREGRVSVAWAGEVLGLGRMEAVRWYTSRGHRFPDQTEEELVKDLENIRRL